MCFGALAIKQCMKTSGRLTKAYHHQHKPELPCRIYKGYEKMFLHDSCKQPKSKCGNFSLSLSLYVDLFCNVCQRLKSLKPVPNIYPAKNIKRAFEASTSPDEDTSFKANKGGVKNFQKRMEIDNGNCKFTHHNSQCLHSQI